MKTFPCKKKDTNALNRHVNGTFYLYPDWNDKEKTYVPFIGRKMPDGRVFIPYHDVVEMYEPGEYEILEVEE